MKLIYVAPLLALMAVPAFAQKQMPRYGEPDPDKTPSEMESERKAAADYKRSLGNVPNAAPVDPWGSVRGDGNARPTAKPAPAKRTQPAPAVK